ncbi:MAG: hypothetical protein LUQ31_04110 [Methanoregula sp.]|nr:hypothetical protein [Methanoregula sp.]
MDNKRVSRRENEDGVSEAIGFMLIFAIIMAGIGLVTLYGYPMLLQQQSSSDEQIMEKNMIVLQNDLKSLAYKTVPYKETSLKVGGGALAVYNMSYSTDSSAFVIADTQSTFTPITFRSGDLRYESVSAQTGISLENGAVLLRKTTLTGSAMLAEPRWFYDSTTNTAVIYLIGFNSTEMMSRVGIGTVKMALGETDYTEYEITAGDTVTVHYIPDTAADYSTAWNNYFANSLKMTDTGSGYYKLPFDPAKTGKLVINRDEIIIKSV